MTIDCFAFAPCRDCADRCVTLEHNCHTDCPKYLEYKKKQEEGAQRHRSDSHIQWHENTIRDYRKVKRK